MHHASGLFFVVPQEVAAVSWTGGEQTGWRTGNAAGDTGDRHIKKAALWGQPSALRYGGGLSASFEAIAAFLHQEAAGDGVGIGHDGLGRALRDHEAAVLAAAGAHI